MRQNWLPRYLGGSSWDPNGLLFADSGPAPVHQGVVAREFIQCLGSVVAQSSIQKINQEPYLIRY